MCICRYRAIDYSLYVGRLDSPHQTIRVRVRPVTPYVTIDLDERLPMISFSIGCLSYIIDMTQTTHLAWEYVYNYVCILVVLHCTVNNYL